MEQAHGKRDEPGEMERAKFDVACALLFVTPEDRLPNLFPEKRKLGVEQLKAIDRCLEPDSISRSHFKIRDNLDNRELCLKVGLDKLIFAPGGSIILGGSGVTIQLLDPEINRFYALKVPRVSVVAYKGERKDTLDVAKFETRFNDEARAFKNERTITRWLSHPNLAQHVFGGEKESPYATEGETSRHAHVPYTISEWIEGAEPLHKYLRAYLSDGVSEKALSLDRVISLIEQSFSGLAHMHENKIMHWDIKSDNLLVSKNHVIKLIDFGNAKRLDGPAADDTTATTTEGKYPHLSNIFEPAGSDLHNGESNEPGLSDSRRYTVNLADPSWNDPSVDLWMLAQEWNRCLKLAPAFLPTEEESHGDKQLSIRDRDELSRRLKLDANANTRDRIECVRLVVERILFAFDRRFSHHFISNAKKLDRRRFYYGPGDEGKYNGAHEVSDEFRRISLPFGDAGRIPELLVSLDDIVRLPVTGNSIFTNRVRAVAESRLIRPTRHHNQLAQVLTVYPGARHSRYEHILGTVTTTASFVRALYLNEMNAFWRITVAAEDIEALLLAAIFHDMGHIAFGHFLEEMSDFFSGLRHTDFTIFILKRCLKGLGIDVELSPSSVVFRVSNDDIDELLDILRTHWVGPIDTLVTQAKTAKSDLVEASEMACETKRIVDGRVSSLVQSVIDILEADFTDTAPSIPTYLCAKGTRAALDSILRSIIDGPLDADKLDYLRRDALHAGVFFSNGIDLERFLESLRVCIDVDVDHSLEQSQKAEVGHSNPVLPSIGVSEKGIAAMESIVTARYHLFAVVYWHRTTRCATAMLQRVLSDIFLCLDDTRKWERFFSDFLYEYRNSTDVGALAWLEAELERQHLSNRRLLRSPLPWGERKDQRSPRKAKDAPSPSGPSEENLARLGKIVADIKNESRAGYFKVAFELSYTEIKSTRDKIGWFGREQLQRAIADRAYPFRPAKPSLLWTPEQIKKSRQRLAEFRVELEEEFEKAVHRLGHKAFELDTILIDIPEPGKDQIKRLQADNRSKRNRLSDGFLEKVKQCFPKIEDLAKPDFAKVTEISPIAGSMDNALERWARKTRIFMSGYDLKQLQLLDLEYGDIALLWECVLRSKFEVYNENQATIPF